MIHSYLHMPREKEEFLFHMIATPCPGTSLHSS